MSGGDARRDAEDEFQRAVRYRHCDPDRILFCLVAALARLPAAEALDEALAALHGLAAGGAVRG